MRIVYGTIGYEIIERAKSAGRLKKPRRPLRMGRTRHCGRLSSESYGFSGNDNVKTKTVRRRTLRTDALRSVFGRVHFRPVRVCV